MTFELGQDDFDTLLLALGVASGSASRQNITLARRFLRLANTINKNNPNWISYADVDKLTAPSASGTTAGQDQSMPKETSK